MAASPSRAFMDAVKMRRSYYSLTPDSPISDAKIVELVQQVLVPMPSTFNSQGTRVLVLFGDDHDWLWGTAVLETVKLVAPPEVYPRTIQKVNSCFRSGHGTVLFFEDQKVVTDYQAKFALYRDHIPTWSLESNAMVQYGVWVVLEEHGLGASLQHYDPLIDEMVRSRFGLPEYWVLRAEMPFGTPTDQPLPTKTFIPIESRVLVFGQAKKTELYNEAISDERIIELY